MIRGKDWYIDAKGDVKVNYGGFEQPNWDAWQEKFFWYPKKIVVNRQLPDTRVYLKVSKWIWLKTIYVRRRRVKFFPTISPVDFEYEYAEDLFDLIKKESR